MKTSINDVSFSAFRAFAHAMSGGFCSVREVTTSRSVSVALTVPRFMGEKFSEFLSHFDGSETLGADGAATGRIALTKPEKDFLRSIFESSDAALAEQGAAAGRVRYTARSTGKLRIELAGSRELDVADAADEVAAACEAAKAAAKAAKA